MIPNQDSDPSTPTLPPMVWTPNLTMTNLGNLYRWVERVAIDAIAWYMNEKKEKHAGRAGYVL